MQNQEKVIELINTIDEYTQGKNDFVDDLFIFNNDKNTD